MVVNLIKSSSLLQEYGHGFLLVMPLAPYPEPMIKNFVFCHREILSHSPLGVPNPH